MEFLILSVLFVMNDVRGGDGDSLSMLFFINAFVVVAVMVVVVVTNIMTLTKAWGQCLKLVRINLGPAPWSPCEFYAMFWNGQFMYMRVKSI